MSLFPLDALLKRLISHGRLTVIDVNGRAKTFTGGTLGPSAAIRIKDPKTKWRLVRNPDLALGEEYMAGSFTIEEGTLRDFLEVVMVSALRAEPGGVIGAVRNRLAAALGGRNTLGRAARNVRHHYDIDHRLYELFLDEDMQYSCAYWRPGVTSLEEAQRDKRRHIARKLLLRPGMKVLDIGSGWGGLALHLAAEHDVSVTGITLSTDQYETSVRRAQAAGLVDKVTFKLLDYRQEPGTYDRIVSVGMFEHVGRQHFGEFFTHLDRLLKPDGVALLHTITRMATPTQINSWIRKYIFPGGYLPSLSQLAGEIEKHKLWLTDNEVLRIHYAKTLEAWNDRVQAHRAEIAAMHDERFLRMWEFYLQTCETSFRHGDLCVLQLQMAKAIGTVPITRDYAYERAGEAASEAAVPPAPRVAAAKTASGATRRSGEPARRSPESEDGGAPAAKSNGHAPARRRTAKRKEASPS